MIPSIYKSNQLSIPFTTPMAVHIEKMFWRQLFSDQDRSAELFVWDNNKHMFTLLTLLSSKYQSDLLKSSFIRTDLFIDCLTDNKQRYHKMKVRNKLVSIIGNGINDALLDQHKGNGYFQRLHIKLS